jgi:hypothetical protein
MNPVPGGRRAAGAGEATETEARRGPREMRPEMSQNNLPAPPHVQLFGMPWQVAGYTHDEADLPVMQVELSTIDRHEPMRFSMAAGSYLSFFTGHLIERSRVHAVGREDVQAIAAILAIEATDRLAFEIADTVIGYAAVIAHGWHSPRFFRELAGGLESNPAQIIEKYRGDPFVSLVIARLQRDVSDIIALHPFNDRAVLFRKAARHLRDQVRTLIPRGGTNDKPIALFWQHLVKMARRLGSDLRLPSRDESRGGPATTPFLEFADRMRRLLAAQGRALAANQNDKRFGRVNVMTRVGLIIALEHAKAAVAAETN